MSGRQYLNGRKWAQITRDERFFCQRLLVLAEQRLPKFIEALRVLAPELDLPGTDWELAYEVCFYRDLRHHLKAQGKDWPLGDEQHSPKRTWDLCLFGPDRIIIIEAKAQQPFGPAQLADFEADRANVRHVCNIEPQFLFLASSRYLTSDVVRGLRGRFPGAGAVTWLQLASIFDRDEDLLRADSLYADTSKTGAELLDLWRAGADLAVGRSGGIRALQNDLPGESWKKRLYATADKAGKPNWFSLRSFVEAVAPTELSTGLDPASTASVQRGPRH